MIFVTVGSMLPFERLVAAMDRWAGEHPEDEVFMQIHGGRFEPRHARFAAVVTPSEFQQKIETASLIVAHAGMGSVMQSAQAGKPLVLLPRRQALREHNTDHQLHTVKWLKDRPGIFVAMDEAELDEQIARARAFRSNGERLPATAPDTFVSRLRASILG